MSASSNIFGVRAPGHPPTQATVRLVIAEIEHLPDAGFTYNFACNIASLTTDMAVREQLPQTNVPALDWYARDDDGAYLNDGWGPRSVGYPRVQVPVDAGCDAVTWERERILTVALRYLNNPGNPNALDYRHHHIPAWNPPTDTFVSGDKGQPESNNNSSWSAGSGLDCSNFASWVYNFGLGIKFTSDVRALTRPSLGIPAKRMPKDGPFQLGDLIFMHPNGTTERASHVVIYINDDYVIDARYDYLLPDGAPSRGVHMRPRVGWYRRAVLGGWRIIGQ
jgi:cell wall-associated NlpC family hydrolase